MSCNKQWTRWRTGGKDAFQCPNHATRIYQEHSCTLSLGLLSLVRNRTRRLEPCRYPENELDISGEKLASQPRCPSPSCGSSRKLDSLRPRQHQQSWRHGYGHLWYRLLWRLPFSKLHGDFPESSIQIETTPTHSNSTKSETCNRRADYADCGWQMVPWQLWHHLTARSWI